MELKDTTNPLEGEDTAEANLTETQEVDADSQDLEQFEAGDASDAEAEDEELELDEGLKLKVPKDQAQRIRDGWLRQSDYTRKTQELAEARRGFEAERKAASEASEVEMSAYALATGFGGQIHALDENARKMGGWTAWARTDAPAAYEAFISRAELERNRQQAQEKLDQLREQRATEVQQEAVKRIGEAAAILEREIGWSATKAAELMEGGIREYGFERSEIDRFEDARMVIALHDALQWRAHQQRQKAVSRHQSAQAARPAVTVQARKAPPVGLDDGLPADEWVRRRNEQLRKRS
jgi:hypothetical protein